MSNNQVGKMKKIVTMCLVLLPMVGLMWNTACKAGEGFDIRDGVWLFTLTDSENNESYFTYSFHGNKNSGEVTWEVYDIGTYRVSRNLLIINVTHFTTEGDLYPYSYQGTFESKNRITGTYTRQDPEGNTQSGTFEAYY
jgi:hypothetical protein